MIKVANVGLIVIEYDENTKEQAEKLITTLNKNYYGIAPFIEKDKVISFINKSESNYFITAIEEFKKILRKNYEEKYNDLKSTSIKQEINFLRILILDRLKRLEEEYPSIAFRTDYEKYINNIYSLLASKYYQETNNQDEYITFLLELSESEKEKIFEWLNGRRRCELYNNLIDEQYNMITRTDSYDNMYDPFIKNNIEKLIDYIQQYTSTNNLIIEDDINEDILPSLSIKNLENLMEEYLIKIDPTLRWLKLYKNAMNSGDIKYTLPNLDWYCVSEDGEITISAPLSNTIIDFPNLIHEFVHYISDKNIGDYDYIYNSIIEYPPLFFEFNAINFLKEKGYPEATINMMINKRIFETQHNNLTACSILMGILEKQQDIEITKDSKMQRTRKASKTYEKIPKNLKRYIYGILSPDEESINDFIDEENEFILYDKNNLINSYPYIIGYYLNQKTQEALNNDSILIEKVMEIAENLVNESFETIVEKLDITTEFNCDMKAKQYTKKEQS